MKKAAAVFFVLMLCCLRCAAKDALLFSFPDAGQHKTECPSDFPESRCFAPLNQTGADFREMYIFSLYPAEISLETAEKKQIFHDSFKYKDITIEYAYKTPEDIMFLWCSKLNNTCAVNRIFKGRENIISALYLNRAPHYSQNMFGRQTNILAEVRIYDKTEPKAGVKDLIEFE